MNRFWDFPHWSKLDVLKEGPYDDTIEWALTDSETKVGDEIDDTRTVIYGDEQALLVQHNSITLRWTLRLIKLLQLIIQTGTTPDTDFQTREQS